MSGPILIPAYPSVLRAGLPVVFAGARYVALGPSIDGCVAIADVADGVQYAPSGYVGIDLRDPAACDACKRAVWHKLCPPGDGDPWNCPRFWKVEAMRRWNLSTDTAAGTYFTADPGRGSPYVPALAAVPLNCSDRDLLALAEVAKAVLS